MNGHCLSRIGQALALAMGVLSGSLLGEVPAVGDVIVWDAAQVQMIRLTREQAEESFVQSVFRNQRSVDAARHSAERELGQQVEHVAQIGTLTGEQRDKLQLAGQGDICRFFDAFDSVLQAAPLGPLPQHEWQQAWQEVQQRLQPLQAQYQAGLHGEESLFRKTIPSALSSEQLVAFQKMEDERSRKHYQALVKATLAAIDNTVPLTADQRAQIIKLVVEKTEPPQGRFAGENQYQFVLYQMSQIQDDLKPLFTDREWPRMQTVLRHGAMMERLLRRHQGNRARRLQDAFGMQQPAIHVRHLGFGGAQIEGDVILRAEAFDNARRAQERALRQEQAIQRLEVEKAKIEALMQQREKRRAREEVEKIPDR
jgi:hypothetical protein